MLPYIVYCLQNLQLYKRQSSPYSISWKYERGYWHTLQVTIGNSPNSGSALVQSSLRPASDHKSADSCRRKSTSITRCRALAAGSYHLPLRLLASLVSTQILIQWHRSSRSSSTSSMSKLSGSRSSIYGGEEGQYVVHGLCGKDIREVYMVV